MPTNFTKLALVERKFCTVRPHVQPATQTIMLENFLSSAFVLKKAHFSQGNNSLIKHILLVERLAVHIMGPRSCENVQQLIALHTALASNRKLGSSCK